MRLIFKYDISFSMNEFGQCELPLVDVLLDTDDIFLSPRTCLSLKENKNN